MFHVIQLLGSLTMNWSKVANKLFLVLSMVTFKPMDGQCQGKLRSCFCVYFPTVWTSLTVDFERWGGVWK